jgi:hypothetical protein
VIAALGATGGARVAGTIVFVLGVVGGFGIGVAAWIALAAPGAPPDDREAG